MRAAAHGGIFIADAKAIGRHPLPFTSQTDKGLDKFGYENNPIEKMAYDAEASFKRSSAIFDAEKFVAEKLRRL